MTIYYDDDGAVAPKQQAWPDKAVGYSEDDLRGDGEDAPDPVDKSLSPDMSGTVETSDTSGDTRDAGDISSVFREADAKFATHDQEDSRVAPEGLAQAPEIDPAASGEDALKPDYSQARADLSKSDEQREEAAAEQGSHTTTMDTTEAGAAPAGSAGNESVPTPLEGAFAPGGTDQTGLKDEVTAETTPGADEFDVSKDPGNYSVAQVSAVLKNASPEDSEKVIAQEKQGQNRKGITGE